MSGSGGGGGWRPTNVSGPDPPDVGSDNGNAGPASKDDCGITETTTLNSPNRRVVSTLRVGEELDIELQLGPPRQLLATKGGEVAGSITSPKSAQIILCIHGRGLRYIAVVSTIRGGLCRVEIRPK